MRYRANISGEEYAAMEDGYEQAQAEVRQVQAQALRDAARRYDETQAGPGDHAAAWLRAEADRIETS